MKLLADLIATMPGITAETPDADVLAWLHQTVQHRSPDARVDERAMYARMGPTAAEAILVRIEASPRIPARAKAWLAPEKGGIELFHPSTLAMLDEEVAANADDATTGITAAQRDALLAAFEVQMPRWQANKIKYRPNTGDVEQARAQ